MTVHIIKLCVGTDSIEDLARWQKKRLKEKGDIYHRTRQTPRRRAEVLDGGSLYWVIRGLTMVRQRIVDLRETVDAEGIPRCDIMLDSALVPTSQAPRRPFQGWRYLKPEDAPRDLARGEEDDGLPLALRRELAEWGVVS